MNPRYQKKIRKELYQLGKNSEEIFVRPDTSTLGTVGQALRLPFRGAHEERPYVVRATCLGGYWGAGSAFGAGAGGGD